MAWARRPVASAPASVTQASGAQRKGDLDVVLATIASPTR
jgi:hypothetical protein